MDLQITNWLFLEDDDLLETIIPKLFIISKLNNLALWLHPPR